MTEQDPRDCDVVLEGGVTSAVIYAGLLARLSETYRFRCLGGTSAGAVAAAAGAIAERARLATGQRTAFDALEAFPSKLAEVDAQGRTVLFRLFQAQPATRRGYRVVAAALQHGGSEDRRSAVLPVAWALVRNFPLAALMGAFPGLWFIVNGLRQMQVGGPGWAQGMSVLLGLVLLVFLGLGVALLWGLFQTLRGMVGNHFGLCNGMPAAGHDGDALTPKLHELYNGLLGRTPKDPPVVFGALWGAGREREIDLQMITTALNLSRPLRLPNDPGVDPLRAFFYDPMEWDELFPKEVMKWLREHQRASGALRVTSRDGQVLAALPEPPLWPIVMAVRLSLSFPGLLSAIPMYTINGRRGIGKVANAPGDVHFVADKVYFSDGGITSNCPIHLFDAPLPTRPTFGVNLWPLQRGDERGPVVWMHSDRLEPELRLKALSKRGTLAAAFGFVAAIVRTAIDWRDSVQRRLPGYRERIVHIGLPPNEGGLNLAMPRDVIIDLGVTGAKAADRLVQEFTRARTAADGRPNAWDLHRWIRMRSTLAATRQHLAKLCKRVRVGKPPYRRLPQTMPAPHPRFVEPAAADQAQALMDGVDKLMTEIDAVSPQAALEDNAPQPEPTLRMSSPW